MDRKVGSEPFTEKGIHLEFQIFPLKTDIVSFHHSLILTN